MGLKKENLRNRETQNIEQGQPQEKNRQKMETSTKIDVSRTDSISSESSYFSDASNSDYDEDFFKNTQSTEKVTPLKSLEKIEILITSEPITSPETESTSFPEESSVSEISN